MEKKDIFIVILCVILLFLWFANQPRMSPQQVTRPGPQLEEAPRKTVKENSEEISVEKNSESISKLPPNLSKTPTEVLEYFDLLPGKPVSIEVEDFTTFTFDPDLGGITDVIVSRFKDLEGDLKMRLGNPDFPVFSVNTKEQSWEFSRARIDLLSDDQITISRAIVGTPLVITQSWKTFSEKPYSLDYYIELKNFGTSELRLTNLEVFCGIMSPMSNAKGFMGAGGIDQRVDLLKSGEESPESIPLSKIVKYTDKDRKETKSWLIKWIAVQNKYFTWLVSGNRNFSGCNLKSVQTEVGNDQDEELDKNVSGSIYLHAATLRPGQTEGWKLNCFIGPKKYDLLKELDQGMESILQFDLFVFFHFGWMEGISLSILWCLKKLEGVFHNYGIAIIIVTLFIRLIFWPITHQTTLWSKKMQKIQPLAQEIREKYKSDPQKMQRKTMELYREHKINPVAGCLPVVLQIPVFFALFNVLRSAIELRQAGFLWVSDLSQQDTIFTVPLANIPINPLAILMGLTMVWQQKTIPTSADPMQQKVMVIMTFFFVIMLYTMPSGLTLYWSVSQLMSILQHKLTRQIEGKA